MFFWNAYSIVFYWDLDFVIIFGLQGIYWNAYVSLISKFDCITQKIDNDLTYSGDTIDIPGWYISIKFVWDTEAFLCGEPILAGW